MLMQNLLIYLIDVEFDYEIFEYFCFGIIGDV